MAKDVRAEISMLREVGRGKAGRGAASVEKGSEERDKGGREKVWTRGRTW